LLTFMFRPASVPGALRSDFWTGLPFATVIVTATRAAEGPLEGAVFTRTFRWAG